jgi:hypothetical protein
MPLLTLPIHPGRKKPFVLHIMGPALLSKGYGFEGYFLHGHKILPGTLTFPIPNQGGLYHVGDGTEDNKSYVAVNAQGEYTHIRRSEIDTILDGTFKGPAVPPQWRPLVEFKFPAPKKTWVDDAFEDEE